MNLINILGQSFTVIDSIEKINIADSFVVNDNKIGEGSGEAKLYIGQVGDKLINFFGERGFEIDCFLTKQNLYNYLNSTYIEHKEPSQNYKNKSGFSQLWESKKDKILKLENIINFKVKDQNQILGPRLYINASKEEESSVAYKLIREISLPIISHINIYKLSSINNQFLYYFKLFLNDTNEIIESEIEDVFLLDENSKFIPLSEDINEIEKEIQFKDDQGLEEIRIPFDPNKIRVRTESSSIGQLISDLEDNIINLNTDFQRLANLWDYGKKSRFIESLILKLPIPAFYLSEKEENSLEVVDGLQRISTINSFIFTDKFKLQKLEFLNELEGLRYEDLPLTYQKRIEKFQITTYIIEKGTPNEVKYNIFKRVNTGGLELKPQEIRHAINQGKPSKLVADLVDINTIEGKLFHKATDYRMNNSKRMEDRDFANRFVAFYLIPYREYKPDLDTFLNNGMSSVKELTDNQIEELKNDFRKSMSLAFNIFGIDAFRKRFKAYDNRKPINKSIFDCLSVCLAKLTNDEVDKLKNRKQIFKTKFIELNNNDYFLRAITQGTAQKESVVKRFDEMKKIIADTLNND